MHHLVPGVPSPILVIDPTKKPSYCISMDEHTELLSVPVITSSKGAHPDRVPTRLPHVFQIPHRHIQYVTQRHEEIVVEESAEAERVFNPYVVYRLSQPRFVVGIFLEQVVLSPYVSAVTRYPCLGGLK